MKSIREGFLEEGAVEPARWGAAAESSAEELWAQGAAEASRLPWPACAGSQPGSPGGPRALPPGPGGSTPPTPVLLPFSPVLPVVTVWSPGSRWTAGLPGGRLTSQPHVMGPNYREQKCLATSRSAPVRAALGSPSWSAVRGSTAALPAGDMPDANCVPEEVFLNLRSLCCLSSGSCL